MCLQPNKNNVEKAMPWGHAQESKKQNYQITRALKRQRNFEPIIRCSGHYKLLFYQGHAGGQDEYFIIQSLHVVYVPNPNFDLFIMCLTIVMENIFLPSFSTLYLSSKFLDMLLPFDNIGSTSVEFFIFFYNSFL